MTMAYLRGTARNSKLVYKGPRSLQDQVNYLRKKIKNVTPALVYFHKSVELTDPDVTANYKSFQINITADFTSDAKFRNNVIGDEFMNKYLKLRYNSDGNDVTALRIIVYSSKLGDTIFQPSPNAAGLSTIPDPAAFKVFYDKFLTNENSLANQTENIFVGLRDLVTIYNDSNNTLERNPIRVVVLWQVATATSNTAGTMGYQYCVRDK